MCFHLGAKLLLPVLHWCTLSQPLHSMYQSRVCLHYVIRVCIKPAYIQVNVSSLLCHPPCAILSLLVQGDEDLLKVFLQYIHRCCSSSNPRTAVYLLGPELADLLDGAKVVRPEVRHGALSAVYAAMTAAMQSDEVTHAACALWLSPSLCAHTCCVWARSGQLAPAQHINLCPSDSTLLISHAHCLEFILHSACLLCAIHLRKEKE